MDIKHNQQLEKLKDFVIKALAVVGFIAILAAGTWGSVQVVRYSPALKDVLAAAVVNLSERFSKDNAKMTTIEFTGPFDLITSGEAFELTWESTADSDTYELSYECSDGFYFETEAGEMIPCGEPFPFVGPDHALPLVAQSKKHHFFDVIVSLATIPNEKEEQVTDVFLLTVVNKEAEKDLEAIRNEVVAPANGGAVGGATFVPSTPVLSGLPDLAVQILATGILERDTDLFIATSSINRGQVAAVQFEVSNIGTNVSGPWTFTAKLPTTRNFVYEAKEQLSLNPGDRVKYTLSFDRLTHSSEGLFAVTIDPDETLVEINKANNKANVTLQITTGSNSR